MSLEFKEGKKGIHKCSDKSIEIKLPAFMTGGPTDRPTVGQEWSQGSSTFQKLTTPFCQQTATF